MTDAHAAQGRWAGRNSDKDAVRADIWGTLDEGGFAMGPTWSHIPNFIGADMAAWRLGQLPQWRAAKVVKCNPDPPQIPVRLRALYDGKMLYAPVPELVLGFPFVLLDPAKLEARGVTFELAATSLPNDGVAIFAGGWGASRFFHCLFDRKGRE